MFKITVDDNYVKYTEDIDISDHFCIDDVFKIIRFIFKIINPFAKFINNQLRKRRNKK